MTTDYNVRLELDVARADLDTAADLVDALAAYSPAVAPTAGGRLEVIFTVPATDFVQLMQTTIALVAQATSATIEAVNLMTTAEFDRRLGLEPIPDLISVTDTAAALGVSRQAVLQRLESGSLPGRKVGNTWVIQRAAVKP